MDVLENRLWKAPEGGDALLALVREQESRWPFLVEARRKWSGCLYREMRLGDFSVLLQHNPSREANCLAEPDPEALLRRDCFLCVENLPPEEVGLDVGNGLIAFVNPYPIFYPHLTVISRTHRPQALAGNVAGLLSMAARFPAWTFLYNGARCGASVPEHYHLQGFPRYSTPLETDLHHLERKPYLARYVDRLFATGDLEASTVREYGRTVLVLKAVHEELLSRAMDTALDALPSASGEGWAAGAEPPVNIAAWGEADGRITVCIFPRSAHRPSCYGKGRESGGRLFSPGLIDMAGVVIAPRRHDFDTPTEAELDAVFREVSLPPGPWLDKLRADFARQFSDLADGPGRPVPETGSAATLAREPVLRVGLAEGRTSLTVRLDGPWGCSGEKVFPGEYEVTPEEDGIRMAFREGRQNPALAPEDIQVDRGLFLSPRDAAGRFVLGDVTVGADFHWEFNEDLTYEGSLEIVNKGGKLTAVNTVALERYLGSVIASEMRPDAPEAFLEAHAIISRSWVLAQVCGERDTAGLDPSSRPDWDMGRLTWTDRSRHRDFDVCNDDHCQRYQGLLRISNSAAAVAVHRTRGLVVWAGEGIVDTRFSKCCGGLSESFRNAWGDFDPPGIRPVRDAWPDELPVPDLTAEEAAREWVESSPPACCNTRDPEILSRILPDFDRATTDFFRWEKTIPRAELEELLRAKTGWDPGRLLGLQAVQRGVSGRIVRLRIRGERGELLVGKELAIRRILSPSHLFSSAFVIDPVGDAGGAPEAFRLRGAGWGHGVGLCQIGAAVMACRGATAEEILAKYFPGTSLHRLYA